MNELLEKIVSDNEEFRKKKQASPGSTWHLAGMTAYDNQRRELFAASYPYGKTEKPALELAIAAKNIDLVRHIEFLLEVVLEAGVSDKVLKKVHERVFKKNPILDGKVELDPPVVAVPR